MSFAILAIAHFAAHKLNFVFVALVLLLYAAFSLWMRTLLQYNAGIMLGFLDDLRALQASGQLMSRGANQYLDGWATLDRFEPMAWAVLVGTFAGVAFYLVYSACKQRRQQ